jgi:hypothetical protein
VRFKSRHRLKSCAANAWRKPNAGAGAPAAGAESETRSDRKRDQHVRTGISAYVVLPNDRTVADAVLPLINAAYGDWQDAACAVAARLDE